MKRSWIGLLILVAVLLCALLVTALMARIHEQLKLELLQSSECALLGQWEDVQLFLHRAKRNWKRWEPLRSAVVGHEALEDIDAAFALLESCRQGKNTASYRMVCAGLISRVEALEELHRLSWKNFL